MMSPSAEIAGTPECPEALVIGAGPAGLMAASALAQAGCRVLVTEAMPTPARKFLMAGRSGLNLTMNEPAPEFIRAFAPRWLDPVIADFGPEKVMAWADDLGAEVFTGSTGRVFPRAMKASPLLRAWLARLQAAGVELRCRWHWTGWHSAPDAARTAFRFDTPGGARSLAPEVTVLALGGASWARLGSDGAWSPLLAARGVLIAPFRPANMGLNVAWSPHMARHFGQPVKGVALTAAGRISRGEVAITARGIEGGGVYALSAAVRDGAALTLDLVPDRTVADVAARLARTGSANPSDSRTNQLRKALGLDPAKIALLHEWGRVPHPPFSQSPFVRAAASLPPSPRPPSARPQLPRPQAARLPSAWPPSPPGAADASVPPGSLPAGEALAALIKALPVRHDGPRPLDEAISVAGGLMAASLTDELELRALPGVFACGEMLDWEAPTGGYLISGCLASGLWAGAAAARRVALAARS